MTCKLHKEIVVISTIIYSQSIHEIFQIFSTYEQQIVLENEFTDGKYEQL